MNYNYCNICVEYYNKTSRNCVSCKSCNFECCTICLEQYFKTSKASPQCMSCHKPWNHQYLKETFGISSLKRILENKKELLFNEQKSLLPHTQEYVNIYNRKIEVKKLIRKNIEEIKESKLKLYKLNLVDRELDSQIIQFQRNCLNPQTIIDNKNKKIYIQSCNNTNCKGFINEEGECELCKTKYCKRCMVEKNEHHVCNENDVLSVETIKKDSKPCPTCSTMIYRISGCPDMFCTSCYSSFNWNNLEIDNNGNSNPLYYKWLREGAGLPSLLTNNCNGQTYDIYYMFNSECYKNDLSYSFKNVLSDSLSALHHTTREYRQFFRGSYEQLRRNINYETLTLKLRKDFMINKTNENNFKVQLLKIKKQEEYNNNIQHIRDLVEDFRLDSIRRVVLSSYENKFDYNDYIQSYGTFSEYINKCVHYLSQLFYNNQYENFINIPQCLSDEIIRIKNII